MKREISKELEMKIKKNMTRLLIVVLLFACLISVDILLVTKAHVGPFLAIRTKVYKDGGTKEYYGLGYKVIKYHQVIGRRDTQVGFWTMPYSVKPTPITSLDLALAFRNYPKKTYKKYYNQYLQIEGKVSKIDQKNKQLTLRYQDEDGAYKLDILCELEEVPADDLKSKTVEIVGNLTHFSNKKTNKPMTVTLKHCFLITK